MTSSKSSSQKKSSPKSPNAPDARVTKVASLIAGAQNIIVLSGAGLSTAASIPDFRSLSGFYNKPPEYLKKYNLEDPSDVFDLDYFRDTSPIPFFEVCRSFFEKEYEPTLGHHFIHLLQKKGKLRRYYTQNIDGLDEKVGEYDDGKLVYCHGSFSSATCVSCGAEVRDMKRILEQISKEPIEVPLCESAKCKKNEDGPGVLKPNIVLFGESLPREFHASLEMDRGNTVFGIEMPEGNSSPVDLIIILGTSLNVAPVSMIPSLMPRGIPRVLINMEPVGNFKKNSGLEGDSKNGTEKKKSKDKMKSYEDYFLPGDLQKTVAHLLGALGWDEEIEQKPSHVDEELLEAMKQLKL